MTNFIFLSLLVVLQVLGNISIGYGIKQIGEVTTFDPITLLMFGVSVLTNDWVVFGILAEITALIVYLAVLSRLDLSYVLPMTASSYLLATLCAWLLLGEQVSATRWAGTFLVTMGVLFVGLEGSAGGKAARRRMRLSRQRR